MGFSFAKLLLLIVVLAAVWFGWRYLRIREKEQEIAAERARQGGVAKAALKEEAEILAPCRVCKAFVAKGSAPCARPDCPQRG
jgi:predicted negative regulator of RcsB-dependent stress response